MTKNIFSKLNWFILYLLMLLGLQSYADYKGWRLLGSNTEKWAPAGYKQHHK